MTLPPPTVVDPTDVLTAPALTRTPASVFGIAVDPFAPTPMKFPATELLNEDAAPVPVNSTPFASFPEITFLKVEAVPPIPASSGAVTRMPSPAFPTSAFAA